MVKKVLVLMGGMSEEREVSLKSGQGVYEALLKKGYQAVTLDLARDNLGQIGEIAPDVVFIALHGRYGEDGTVQGLLDIMGIPYTGSGVATSAICMDKIITKKLLIYEGYPTADFTVLSRSSCQDSPEIIDDLLHQYGLPIVVKAATQGSSIGTYIVTEQGALLDAINQAFDLCPQVLVERFIDGDLLTVAVLGNENPKVLPVIEIVSKNDFYDYESKYTPGMCEHIIPARISPEVNKKVENIAAGCYQALGCRGTARIDFIVDKNGNPYILEVNTIPGMTGMSLVPDAARAVGISYEDLVETLIKLAIEE
ncbi:MAG: D-alanine--D-alanine ligase [Syntrophomonadaceae bacterium]|nr:D-alanine--D-alanine ligase [Syntrophomonadaceae bacterium]